MALIIVGVMVAAALEVLFAFFAISCMRASDFCTSSLAARIASMIYKDPSVLLAVLVYCGVESIYASF